MAAAPQLKAGSKMRVSSHFDGKGDSRYGGSTGRERASGASGGRRSSGGDGGGGGGGGGGVGSLGKISAFSGGGFGAKSSKGKGAAMGAVGAASWQAEHDLSGFEEELELNGNEVDHDGDGTTPRGSGAPAITAESLAEHRRQQQPPASHR